MSLNAKKEAGGGDYKAPPVIDPGTYPARPVEFIDLGVQPQRPFKGEAKPPCHQFEITYELVDEFMKDEEGNDLEDKPRWQRETIPLHNLKNKKAKSTKRYNALDPEDKFDGDFTLLTDIPCNVVISKNPGKGDNADRVYNNVTDVLPMRAKDADRCPPLVNPTKVFVLDDPDMEVFGKLREWLQDKIKANLDYAGSKLEALVEGRVYNEPEEKENPVGNEEW